MRPSAWIFDFNGVLLWDSELQEQAWRTYSRAVRGVALDAEEMASRVHGRTNADVLAYVHRRDLTDAEVTAFAARKEALYRGLCLDLGDDFALSPGAVELLNALRAAGTPFTIATASDRGNVEFFFDRLALADWFDVAKVVYDDGSLAGKPAPDQYLRAAANLDTPPSACVVVEDSRSGIEAARRAGVAEIVALGPADTHSMLAALPGVTRTVSSLSELVELAR